MTNELGKGVGDPDLQDDIIDSQQVMGLEAEERQLLEEQQTEQLDVLEGLRQIQTADPIRWKVFRYGHEESKYNGYLADLQTTSLTLDHIRKKFGGGQYRVRGVFSNGKYATQRTFSIAGESILFIPEIINGAATMQAAGPPAFNLSEFMAAQEIREEKRRDAEERRQKEEEIRAERRAQEQKNFMLQIATIAAPVVTALITKTTEKAPQTDMAALITALKPTAPPESPIQSMKGMMEMMTMMRDMMGDGGGSETAEMIKAVSGLAAPVMTALANRPQQPVPQRPRVQRPAPGSVPTQPGKPPPVTIDAVPIQTPQMATPPTPRPPVPGEQPTILQPSQPVQTGVDLSAPTQPMTPEQQTMFAQMKPQVDALVQLAVDCQDPKAVAEMFFDTYLTTVDDVLYDQMCELFEDPKTIGRMALFNRGVNDHLSWFNDLQTALVAKINQETAQATIQNPQDNGEGVDHVPV